MRISFLLRFLLSCLTTAILISCGGGRGEENSGTAPVSPSPSVPGSTPSTTPTTPTATTPFESKGSLLKGVRVLSEKEIGQIQSETDSQIVFSGPIDFAPGTVVVGRTTTFKVINVRAQNGDIVVEAKVPSIEEIFQTLQIKATAAGAAEALPGLSKATQENRFNAVTGVASSESNFDLRAGGLTIRQNVTNKLAATVDYDYDQAKGGLQSALFNLESELTAKMSGGLIISEKTSTEKLIAQFRIPINVTIVDSLLNTIGVRVVSIYIPIYVGSKSKAELAVALSRGMTINGSSTLRYTQVGGATMDHVFTATSNEDPVPTTPAGAPSFSTFTADLSVFFNLKPAVAFLDKVALLGVSTSVSGDGSGTFQVVPDNPFYCATVLMAINLNGNGYFKGVGIDEITTPAVSTNLFTDQPRNFGACLAPTISDVTSTIPISGKVGRLMTYTVAVNLDPSKPFSSPNSGPTGTVKVNVAEKECEVRLITNGVASASGSCSLTPTIAGEEVPTTISYSGDAKFAVSSRKGKVKIEKSDTIVGMSSTPNPSNVGVAISLSGSVTTLPETRENPTGNIQFRTSEGTVLCTATIISGGRGECLANIPSGTGTKFFEARYFGDNNYNGSTSLRYNHVVNELPSVNGAILTVLDTNQNYTGLPATISLSNLYTTTPTAFRTTGNSCEERGIPLYSGTVPAGFSFYGARSATNIPTRIGGPFINRNNCSSFIAIQNAVDPQSPDNSIKKRVIINATGRAAQFGTATLDWEFQVRYDSGDPFTGANKQCLIGPVGNAGFFGADFAAASCSHVLN